MEPKITEDSNLPKQEPLTGQPMTFTLTGWICPKCGRGISPFVTVCPCVVPSMWDPYRYVYNSPYTTSTGLSPFQRKTLKETPNEN